MRKLFWKFSFKLWGWKIRGQYPKHLKKAIIIAGPHTTNWDLPLGLATRAIQQFDSDFLIKDSWLKLPIIGRFLKFMGAVGVDRGKGERKIRVTDAVVKLYEEREQFTICIAPEGTRSYNPNWKTGFWQIANQAKIPIVPIALDWSTKTVIIEEPFYTTNDKDADIEKLKAILGQATGKIPENGIY